MQKLKKIKPVYIAGFMAVVIGLLASICAVWPQDGVVIGDHTLRFPTLSDMIYGDGAEEETVAGPTEEELRAMEEAAKRSKEEQPFLTFLIQNPTRIHFPNNNYEYLDSFFMALDRAKREPLRIVHYGDSQLEEDRMTNILRRRLQEEFGGGGNGILPVQQSLWSQTVSLSSNRQWTKYQVFGGADGHRGNSFYGPMGAVNILSGSGNVTVRPQINKKKDSIPNPSHYFNRLTLLTKSTNDITASVQGQQKTIVSNGSNLQFTTFALTDSTSTITLNLSGNGDIYGMLLDQNEGVAVDNIPLRGCSGTVFTSINEEQMRTFFRKTNTRMIILQFGGNSMPYLKSPAPITSYVEKLRKQVQHVHALAPDAVILWVGPSDMSTLINGVRQTYPMLSELDKQLCQMVNEEGFAYWSLYESMGGKGSMNQWVKEGKASPDYIHFTRRGATQAGQLLTESLLMSYRYYAWRYPEIVREEHFRNSGGEIFAIPTGDTILQNNPAPRPGTIPIETVPIDTENASHTTTPNDSAHS